MRWLLQGSKRRFATDEGSPANPAPWALSSRRAGRSRAVREVATLPWARASLPASGMATATENCFLWTPGPMESAGVVSEFAFSVWRSLPVERSSRPRAGAVVHGLNRPRRIVQGKPPSLESPDRVNGQP